MRTCWVISLILVFTAFFALPLKSDEGERNDWKARAEISCFPSSGYKTN